MTALTADQLLDAIVFVYGYNEDGTLMEFTFGIVVEGGKEFDALFDGFKGGGDYFALTVGHSLEDRDEVEVWSGLHPLVARNHPPGSAGSSLSDKINVTNSSSVFRSKNLDVAAIRLGNYHGPAASIEPSRVGLLLHPALIACVDFEPGATNVLQKVLDCQAGLVEQEGSTHLRLNCVGQKGMSGAPVVLEEKNQTFVLVGLYAGTRSWPLTKTNTKEHANVVKVSP